MGGQGLTQIVVHRRIVEGHGQDAVLQRCRGRRRAFREAVLRAVNLGDDADTTGAVGGRLAGAYWGESGIPVEWREGLAS